MANLTGAAAGSTGLEGNILVDENLGPGWWSRILIF